MASFLSMSTMAGPPSQDALDHASTLIDQSLHADNNYSDLSDRLSIPKHNQPTASGLLDMDYPTLADPKIGLGALTELGDMKKVPLPAELVEQFGHMQCNCMMGLFPEISRAWLSIDSDIFVWNYEDGTDLAYFDGLSEAILCAGLVLPKPGIFQPHIQYLLCLATPIDIVLLGVSFSKPFEAYVGAPVTFSEMHLLPEPLFSIPTDNMHFCSVRGSQSGRIFLTGKDGCLYELLYQAEDGWFSRKCRKINHSQSKLSFMVPSFLNFSFVEDDPLLQISIDDTRNILYTRSDKGTIQVYDLGQDGKGLGRVAALPLQTIVQYASHVCRTIDRSNFKSIVHIAAIPSTESVNLHLVAITRTGVRLYFTTTSFFQDLQQQNTRPSFLALVHVRLPPGFTASAPPQRPHNVHAAHYSKGTLMLCGSQTEDNDLLWTVTNDAFPFQSKLSETHQTTPIDGKTWAIAEVPCSYHLMQTTRGSWLAPGTEPPVVVTQHMLGKRKFVLINSQGCYLLTKQQPVDQLKQLLLNYGPDSEDVKAFFSLHKEQACATCLILTCNTDDADPRLVEMATKAFFMYGGEPEYNFNLTSGTAGKGLAPSTLGPTQGTPSAPGAGTSFIQGMTSPGGPTASSTFASPGPGMHPHQMSTPFPHVAQQLQFQSPTSQLNTTSPVAPEVIFSGKHNGLCLYLARILRPLWESRMVSDFLVNTQQGNVNYLSSQYSSTELSWILNKLRALREFLDKNSQFANPFIGESFAHISQRHGMSRLGDGMMDDQLRKKYQAEAEAQESFSLKQIQQLVVRACEALGLWNILCDHQFHVIASTLSKDEQKALRNMSFQSFVGSGKEIGSSLITSLINMYIDDNAATDAISSRLREVSPSLYSSEDAICSKANEKMKTARTVQNYQEKGKMLEESLQMYKQITGQLDLPTICNQFSSVRFYCGIVDLSLSAANKRDPQGFALHYYKNGEPQEDTQGFYAFRARMDCYRCITETLEFLLSTSMALPQQTSVPRSPGPPPAPDPNRLTNTEAERYVEEVFTLALRSDDEMFHVALYEWLISKNLSERLLEIQSPFLEPYLKRSASMQPDHLAMLDLLWKYYEKSKDYSAAAKILAKLADRHGTDLTLRERMEYLSRASMCTKSCTLRTSAGAEGEFLHELEEKMEVARLQLQIFETLSCWSHHMPPVQEARERLDSQLFDITTLYGEFADRFDLSECKLAIVHCAGHHDPTLIESLWQDIVEKEIKKTETSDSRTRMQAIKNKLVSLGRTYGGTERYFPLPFLLKHLEWRSCLLHFDDVDPKFTFNTLQEIGITIPRLHELYDRLFKSKDPCWKAAKKPFHLLFVLHQLLDTFAQNPTCVPAYERRHFTTTCLDAVANYLVELQAESTAIDAVRVLNDRFKDLQAKLERII